MTGNHSAEIRRKVLTATLALAGVKLVVHLLTNQRYGYFVDELYYLACSQHLDWGYVDQPPLIAFITWLVRTLLGDSLAALRFLPALAGAGTVLFTGLIVRELGGDRRAAILACLGMIVAPVYLLLNTILTMNAFEPLLWMGCAWLLIRMIQTRDTKLWVWFGLLAGVGLLNKHSMLFFGFAVVVALLLTPERRLLRSPWLWAGAAIALVIFLPNLVWNLRHDFPFFELQRNIRASGRNVALNSLGFLGQQFLLMHPATAPIWVAGLWHLVRRPLGKPYRALGWTYLVLLVLMLLLSGRVYYMAPAYPMLFAAGGIALVDFFDRARRAWLQPAYLALLAVLGLVLAPFFLPILPVEKYVAYSKALHFEPPRIETHRMGPLPQWFADMHGWPEMAAAVADAYRKLSPEDQPRCAIFGQNYGQAGAIDLFGPKLGLPKALSGHQNYFFWGPRHYTGECVLVMDDRPERLQELFESFEKVATVYHPYSMPYQHFDVYLCRRLKFPLHEAWPRIKKWN